MKHFQTLEYSQEVTLLTRKMSQEEDPEAQHHLQWTIVILTNRRKPKFYEEMDFYSNA